MRSDRAWQPTSLPFLTTGGGRDVCACRQVARSRRARVPDVHSRVACSKVPRTRDRPNTHARAARTGRSALCALASRQWARDKHGKRGNWRGAADGGAPPLTYMDLKRIVSVPSLPGNFFRSNLFPSESVTVTAYGWMATHALAGICRGNLNLVTTHACRHNRRCTIACRAPIYLGSGCCHRSGRCWADRIQASRLHVVGAGMEGAAVVRCSGERRWRTIRRVPVKCAAAHRPVTSHGWFGSRSILWSQRSQAAGPRQTWPKSVCAGAAALKGLRVCSPIGHGRVLPLAWWQ